ncbi:MAG: hypothetical protein ABII82_00515 [Verrucomicrobiota bacterium]
MNRPNTGWVLLVALLAATWSFADDGDRTSAPWRQYLGMDTSRGNPTDHWRATMRGTYPLSTPRASISNSINADRLDEVLAGDDWINLQDGYNYRSREQVNEFFDAVRSDGGAAWRANCTRLAQSMVDGNVRNRASGHRAYWELGNEIYVGAAARNIGGWAKANGLPYPHPNSNYNDNPGHGDRMNDRGVIGYQVEYQIALALEALMRVNARAPEGHRVRILSPASTAGSINSGWTDALLDYVIVGYEMEVDAQGKPFTNFKKPLAASLAGKRLRDLIDIVNVHYILGRDAALLQRLLDTYVTPASRIRGVWHTEEGGIRAASEGRGGVSTMHTFPRALDVWLSRGLPAADARLCYYGANTGPEGTTADAALDLLDAFMPAATTRLVRKPELLVGAGKELETYVFENTSGTKRVLFILSGSRAESSTLEQLHLKAGGWNRGDVTGVARIWVSGSQPVAHPVEVTRSADGSGHILAFPPVTVGGRDKGALVLFLSAVPNP